LPDYRLRLIRRGAFTVGGKADITRRRGEREESEDTASLVAAYKARCVSPIGERTHSKGAFENAAQHDNEAGYLGSHKKSTFKPKAPDADPEAEAGLYAEAHPVDRDALAVSLDQPWEGDPRLLSARQVRDSNYG